MSYSLWPHELHNARLPCPSPTPGAYSNSCLSSHWCRPTISSSVIPLLFLHSIFPSIRVFSNESVLCIRWPKYWSFSSTISPQFSSVQFSRSVMSNSLRPHESQHARPPCPSPTPGVHSDSRPWSQWCHQSYQWIFRTGWISLQFKGLARVFSNTTVQKHQFFGSQLSL